MQCIFACYVMCIFTTQTFITYFCHVLCTKLVHTCMDSDIITHVCVCMHTQNEPKAKKPRLEATGTCQPKVVTCTEKRGLAAGSSSSARQKLVQKPQTKTEVASSK